PAQALAVGSTSTCLPYTRPLPLFPSGSIWLRVCIPELVSVPSNLISTSSIKSPYSFSVIKNELGVPLVIVPTITPSSTVYGASPPTDFHPSSVLPSNRFVHLPPFCASVGD